MAALGQLHCLRPFASPSSRRPRQHAARPRLQVAAASGKNDGPKERKPWSFGKFIDTFMFFQSPPRIEDLPKTVASFFSPPSDADTPVVQRLDGAVQLLGVPVPGSLPPRRTKRKPAEPLPADGTPVSRPSDSAVLVAGATGGVGKRVVERLLARGATVRALVRDPVKARELLSAADRAHPGKLEVVYADITQPKTLSPAFLKGVKGVVCATAVRVQPKEGDTPDRKKYLQGVKFYDPEVVGDTPETVEFKGVMNLLTAVTDKLGTRDGKALYAAVARGGKAMNQELWGDLSDPVMGGVSESSFILDSTGGEGGCPAGLFRGTVSTANNGGFCSVRTRNFSPAVDASAYDAVALRLKGDGQRYKLFVRTDPGWDATAFACSFDTQPGVWQTVTLPFRDFKSIFRARTVPGAPPLDPSRIFSLQLMLSKFEYDGELNPAFKGDGSFALPVEWIRAVSTAPVAAPKWIHISSAGVTRPNRPGINVEVEPPAVKLNDALGGLLTFKLRGEEAVMDSGVPFTLIRPVALTEEPEGAPLEVDQGDTIKGKISREEVADLAAFCLSDSSALDKVFEIKSTIPFSTPFVAPEGGGAKPASRDWASLLSGLKAGVTGRTIDGVYTGRLPEDEALRAAGKKEGGGAAAAAIFGGAGSSREGR